MNHFQLLGIKQQYNIDQAELKKQYFLMLAKCHPDKVLNDSENYKALELSININQAYKILQDDYLRAEYLLQLNGYKLDDETLKNVLSTIELEKLWTDFETVEEEKNLEKLTSFEHQKLKEKDNLLQQITRKFSERKPKEALDLTVHLKYLTNLLGNIRLKIKNANNPD